MKRVKVRLSISLPEDVVEKLDNIPWGLKGKVISYLLEEALEKYSIEELATLVLKASSSKSLPSSPVSERKNVSEQKDKREEKEPGITREIEETFGDFTLD